MKLRYIFALTFLNPCLAMAQLADNQKPPSGASQSATVPATSQENLITMSQANPDIRASDVGLASPMDSTPLSSVVKKN